MHTAEQLTLEQLREVVRRLQQTFYLAHDGQRFVWDPDEEHDSETLAEAASVLQIFELAPTGVLPFENPPPASSIMKT